jgi:hypothetical protein
MKEWIEERVKFEVQATLPVAWINLSASKRYPQRELKPKVSSRFAICSSHPLHEIVDDIGEHLGDGRLSIVRPGAVAREQLPRERVPLVVVA